MKKNKNSILIFIIVTIIYGISLLLIKDNVEQIKLLILLIGTIIFNYNIKTIDVCNNGNEDNYKQELYIMLGYFVIYLIFQIINQKMTIIPADFVNIVLLFILPIIILKVISGKKIKRDNVNTNLSNTILNTIITCTVISTLMANKFIGFMNDNELSLMNVMMSFILTLVVVFILTGIPEEYFFRMILQTRLEKLLNGASGVLITSILFAIYHIPYRLYQYGSLKLSILTVITEQFIIGILLGYCWQKTRSLSSIAFIHSFYNSFLLLGTINFG